MQNRSIGYLHLSIWLWMVDWCEFVRNMKFCAELFEVLIVELPTIVNDGVW